ncbi:MAG: hypothetical protein JXA98_03470 [Methanosarcinaceae archaeon]|nr:hypothetical protein [Methanosarcinaceae archaeon]
MEMVKKICVVLLILAVLLASACIETTYEKEAKNESDNYTINAKYEIELDLNEKSNEINKINNDTEKVQEIIRWERNLGLKDFNYYSELDNSLRHMFDESTWYIYLGKGNCGEKALIFEDMADRTNLTYRSVNCDGYIDPSNNETSNHCWSEVWLDDDWRIADAGYDLYHPKDNNLHFTVNRSYLLGPVVAIYENGTEEDRTNEYIGENKTANLVIDATRSGKPVENANVEVILNYHNVSQRVVGNLIKKSTNNTGVCEINLGIYDDVYYTVILNDLKSVYKYSGQKDIKINNETEYLEIELNELKLR